MEFNKELLKMMREGSSIDDIALNLTTALNKAKDEYEKELKEKELEEERKLKEKELEIEKREETKVLNTMINEYIKKYYNKEKDWDWVEYINLALSVEDSLLSIVTLL